MWTPDKEARLAELEANYYGSAPQPQAAPAQPSMGLTQRFARHVGNIPAWFVNTGQSIGDTLLDTETAPRQLFNVPEARTDAERYVDVAGTLTQELAGLATGSGLLTKGARLFGAGARSAPIIGDVATGAISGLRESGAESGMQAGEFGASGAILSALGSRSPVARALIGGAGNIGVGVAGQAIRGNELDSPEALTQMATLGLFPAAQEALGAAGRRLFRRAEPQVPGATPDAEPTIPAGPGEAAFIAPGVGKPSDYGRRFRPDIPDESATPALYGQRPDVDVFAGTQGGPSRATQAEWDTLANARDIPILQQGGLMELPQGRPLFSRPTPEPSTPIIEAPQEQVVSTAIRTGRGLARGDDPNAAHPTLMNRALELDENALDPERFDDALGFIVRGADGTERFASRSEAYQIAQRAGQLKSESPSGRLQSEILAPISPQPRGVGEPVPSMLRSGEPAQAGGLRPLRPSERGAINPNLLGGIAGATVGGLTDPENPLRGAAVGAALGAGGVAASRFLRSDRIRQAADRQMRGDESALGGVGRFMEKNMGSGKAPRLTALDDRAKGEADFYARRMETAIKGAGKMAYGQDLTPAQKAAGEAYIASKGDPVDTARLRAAGVPEEYRNYLETAKDAVKNMQRILMAAESDPRKQSLIADTLGNYQTRQYRYFLDDAFKLNETLKPAAIAEWKRHPMFQDVPADILDSVVTKDLEEHLMGLKTNQGDFTRMGSEGESRISKALYTSRKDLEQMPAYRKLLGEVDDPHEAQVLTAGKLVQSVAQAKVIGDLRNAVDGAGNRFALSDQEWQAQLSSAKAAGDTAKQQFLLDRYVTAPDTPGIGALAGQKVQRQVADYLQFSGHQGLDPGNGSWYAMINSVPKAVFTRLNPATWVRNYGQAVLQGHALGIFDPSRIVKTAWRLSRDQNLADELTRSGVLGGHAGRHEFQQQARKLGASLDKGIKQRLKSVMSAINEGYGKPDQWIRATAYLDELDNGIAKGLSRDEAGLKALEFVNRYSHNYGQVPKLVGKLRNIPLVNPFISYASEMARIMKNLAEDVVTGSDRAVQSGVALTTLLAAPAMLTYAAKEFALSDKEQQELSNLEEIMPPYLRGRMAVQLGRDEKGNFTSFNAQPWLPAGDFVTLAKNILKGDAMAIATNNPVASLSGTPLLNTAAEIMTGEDIVTGRKNRGAARLFNPLLKNVTPTVAPGGYRFQQMQRAFTPNEEGGFGIEEPSGRSITPASALAGTLGFGTQTTSGKRLLRRAEAEIREELAEIKSDLNQVLKTNARADVKEEARQLFRRQKAELMDRRRQVRQSVRGE